ncbi:hypothetical protein VTJ83DRAFT_3717 [Remersonia thermophila]|uniref:FAD-binding domain-containing protein n=1 Tax=Remersonia thermophila TaxID=72144 RepID=A0ABR4DEX0_9PEZI
MAAPFDVDVLIVGAGPVGTALALELALHGVSFRIVDRLAERNDKSRSLVVQPRTLELLSRHGAADAMMARGRILAGGSAYVDGRLASRLDLDDLGTTDTEFPLPLNVSQVETERFLDECLARHGARVERPVAASDIVQDAAGVTVTLTHLAAAAAATTTTASTIRARYVVGCDGAHSAVRHASAAMRFPGAAYPQGFVLCDARLSEGSNLPRDRLLLFLAGTDLLAVLPIDGEHVRVVASERAGSSSSFSSSSSDNDDAGAPSLGRLQAHFARMTPPGSGHLRDAAWLARFRLHRRIVTRYRDGRLLVAGDAAHIHSPAGGQGMNAGIQDAVNLGWKLAAAVALESSGFGPKRPGLFSSEAAAAAAAAAASALLDTYDLERRPVGEDLIRGTDRLFAFLGATPAWLVPLRDAAIRHVVPRAVRGADRRRRFFSFLSNLGISYRGRTRYVGEAPGLAAGGRALQGGDRLVDGRVWAWEEEEEEVEEDRGRGQGAAQQQQQKQQQQQQQKQLRQTSLQRVCAGRKHHLLLFAAPGDESDEDKRDALRRAAEAVADACWAEVEAHYVATIAVSAASAAAAAAAAEVVRRARWYADLEGTLRGKLGFPPGEAGYVLVRPDGYVAHVGPLARLDALLGFLEGYLVLADARPVRSWWAWLAPVAPMAPVAWAAVALVAVKMLAARLGRGGGDEGGRGWTRPAS